MTGDTYAIVVDPGRRQRPASGVSKETAIVANLETMEWPDGGGLRRLQRLQAQAAVQGRGSRSGGARLRAAARPGP